MTHPTIEPYRQALAALDYSRCANRALHAAWQLLPPEAKLHALNIEEVAEIHGADPAALALQVELFGQLIDDTRTALGADEGRLSYSLHQANGSTAWMRRSASCSRNCWRSAGTAAAS